MIPSESDDAVQKALSNGAEALGIPLDDRALEKMLDFLRLMIAWNRVFNLTAVRRPTEMVPRHLLDSLTASPYLRGNRILDLGTGPGLPGIPLAIIHPDKRFVLLDSSGKKIRFVRQAQIELGLTNIEVAQNRIERYRPAAPFDVLMARAYGRLSDILSVARRLLPPNEGVVLAWKGRYPTDELAEVDARVWDGSAVVMPSDLLGGERHLVVLCRS